MLKALTPEELQTDSETFVLQESYQFTQKSVVEKLSTFPLFRLKFLDEKLLKNSEGLQRKVWKDPETGMVPFIGTQPDFRNTYKLLDITSIDRVDRIAFFHKIHMAINDSEEHVKFLDEGAARGRLAKTEGQQR